LLRLAGLSSTSKGGPSAAAEPMSLHHEVAFEREICEHLGANGWIYEEGSADAYRLA